MTLWAPLTPALQSLFDLWVAARKRLSELRSKRVVTPPRQAPTAAGLPGVMQQGVSQGVAEEEEEDDEEEEHVRWVLGRPWK